MSIPEVALWIFDNKTPLKQNTSAEKDLAITLSATKSREYLHSRGYVRYALSTLFEVPSQEIPLSAMPGKVPILPKGWG